MEISQKGIELIKNFEGLKLVAYLCSAGVPTIGIGTTVYFDSKQKVSLGDRITEARAVELFRSDVTETEDYVKKLVKVELSQDQFDALVSFTYNLGPTNLKESTLLRVLNEGDYPLAAAEFRKWRKSGGKVSNGLVRRRKAEEKLFCGCTDYLI